MLSFDFINSIIELVKSAIDGSCAKVSDNIKWEEILDYSKKQSILPLVYYGAVNSKIDIPSEVQQRFDKYLLSHVFIDQSQQYELSKIYNAFNNGNIEYMPIKGATLRLLYPKTEMRPMGDADVLIHVEDRDKVAEFMKELGFKETKESAHEYVFVKGGVCIEMHKCLIPPYSKDYYSYYDDGWRFAKKTSEKCRYEMSADDHFVYMVTHFAKHYRAGGIGVLHMVDFWVYLTKYKLDMNYIRAELDKLLLLKFFDNVMHTVDVWFKGAASDEMTDFITKAIFNNAMWGTDETHSMASAVKASKSSSVKGIKFKRIKGILFPKLKSMQYAYPILKKCPVLLPFVWMWRWIDVLLFKRSKISKRLDEINHTNEENVSEYQQAINYVGLDFNYKD